MLYKHIQKQNVYIQLNLYITYIGEYVYVYMYYIS